MSKVQGDQEYVLVGKISGVYGVKGWLKVVSFTSVKKDLLKYQPWYLSRKNTWQEVKLLDGKEDGKSLIVQLEGINDRDQAALLNGLEIAISRHQLPEPGQNEYYWNDLQGLTVKTTDGLVYGVVSHLIETGANDVLVIKPAANEKDLEGHDKSKEEILIPFIHDQVIKSVDLDNKIIVVDWDADY